MYVELVGHVLVLTSDPCQSRRLTHLEISDNPMHSEWHSAIVKGLPYLFHHCRQVANERKHHGKPPEMEYVSVVRVDDLCIASPLSFSCYLHYFLISFPIKAIFDGGLPWPSSTAHSVWLLTCFSFPALLSVLAQICGAWHWWRSDVDQG